MKFYRVTKEIYNPDGHGTIMNELYTEKERETKFHWVPAWCLEIVEISKQKTHWFFGARFED